MTQFRRLDPLANAGPYQRLLKNPIKSLALSEAQFDRISAQRPQLIVTRDESAVIGFPYRDYLEVHYSFPNLEDFRQNFPEMFDACTRASSREEAPRGVLLPFRDRSNRRMAETVFWGVALEEGEQWVEMNLVAIPEQEEPGDSPAEGYTLREATAADREAISALEEDMGLPPLSEGGMASLLANSTTLRLLLDASGAPAGYLSLTTQPGGWGYVDEMVISSDRREQLVEPLARWSVAWLRNQGRRRVRITSVIDDTVLLPALRNLGFAPGETGLNYARPVDPADVQAKLDERKAHGTLIKFGNWR